LGGLDLVSEFDMNLEPRVLPPKNPPGVMTLDVFLLGLDTCTRDLVALTEYLSMTMRFLDGRRRSFQETYQGVMHDPDFHDAMEDEIDQLWRAFPSTLLGSAYVSACSCLDRSLSALCKALQADSSFAIVTRWEARREAPLQRAKSFLKDNFKLHVHEHEQWSTLMDVYFIRNCIVHANGEVDLMADPNATRETIARQSRHGIAIDNQRQLNVPATFIDHVVSVMTDFWLALERALRENAIVGPKYWP
jgi:hypothetical protein